MEIDRNGAKVLYVNCNCMVPEHTIRFAHHRYSETGDDDFTVAVLVYNWKSFPRRLWSAFKYALKLDRHDTHFDEVLLSKNEAAKIRALLTEYIGDGP